MNRCAVLVLAVATLPWGALAQAASLQKVSNWSGGAALPSYVSMYLYVPDKPATKPPIVVAAHYCTGTASAYFSAVSTIVSAANTQGFIMIFPEATGRNCWDVGSTKSLTHDGGGDTHAIAQMVRYTLAEHAADPSRVYVVGSSSGAMMTQALLGVYPDLFKAGVEFSGVPCGCWAVGYDTGGTPQWSNDCAGGKVTKTAQAWGDQVRAMYPGYTGPRPRIQMWHGTADTTISYNNFTESLKEWSNLLGLPATPTLTETPKTNYEHQIWKNACGFGVIDAWSIKNGTHNIPFEGAAALSFFGLDKPGPDPEAAACSGDAGAGGTGGTGGVSGTGGTTGGGGAGGADGGRDARDATSDGSLAGSGGGPGGTGGGPGTGGRTGTDTGGAGGSATGGGSGGASARGGAGGSGGNSSSSGSASGGSVASGGSPVGGGSGGSGGSNGTSANGGAGQLGSSGTGGATASDAGSTGCSCALGAGSGSSKAAAIVLLLATLALVLNCRQRRRPSRGARLAR